jgi:hypothetical protein
MSSSTALSEAHAALRAWILDNARGLSADTLHDTTPLLEARHITSLQVPELLLLIESLRKRPIDFTKLGPGDLKDLRTISERFLVEGAA